MFCKSPTGTSLRASIFFVRSVNSWNALPEDVVAADSLTIFKVKLIYTGPAPLITLICLREFWDIYFWSTN